MSDLVVALGLVLVIEGALYALFPEGMMRLMAQVMAMPPGFVRRAGVVAVAAGLLIVWLVRG